MKIYTASYWEPEFHGFGRKIGISPSKPKNLREEVGYDCNLFHEFLSPEEIYWNYHKEKKEAGNDEELLKQAGERFTISYNERLEFFKKCLFEEAESSGKSIYELIGLKDGDTLLSWERSDNTTFRTFAAKCLRDLGYDVEER